MGRLVHPVRVSMHLLIVLNHVISLHFYMDDKGMVIEFKGERSLVSKVQGLYAWFLIYRSGWKISKLCSLQWISYFIDKDRRFQNFVLFNVKRNCDIPFSIKCMQHTCSLLKWISELVKFLFMFPVNSECSSMDVGCDTGPQTCMLSLEFLNPFLRLNVTYWYAGLLCLE